MEFDKERFANLLSLAKGYRSINQYGSDSGVDTAYISRLLRCLIERAPSAAIIKKLSDNAYNGITASDLLAAAGYIKSDDNTSGGIDYNKSMQMLEWGKVIEEANRYQISAEVAFELISLVGKSLGKSKK